MFTFLKILSILDLEQGEDVTLEDGYKVFSTFIKFTASLPVPCEFK